MSRLHTASRDVWIDAPFSLRQRRLLVEPSAWLLLA
jgi:hypothetical protein